ncbi:hypothetical protein GCM10007972_04440 [Iodidimonas muriae]|uniref:Flagellar protein FlgJ N-terminal domain-containing protein n=1 Tax=Iodidimonas muriae TaxID=261467 RepID=A0ABQ2L7W7_9PROT|nr:rod-binding protein [Iodidimonas muriae]GER08154.1 hypothetical protein JCM17843_24640 [Kordiimonadales bacterium JCM 17843]GGO06277.1 hypothetical protein GCM10007972_04440 [Iodidimonas muriae]
MNVTFVQTGGPDLGQAALAGAKARIDGARQTALASAKSNDISAREASMREAAEGFEAVFLGQMLAPMFSGLSSDGPMGGGHAEEVFRSMLVDEMGNAIAKAGGVGVAGPVYEKLLSLQEI